MKDFKSDFLSKPEAAQIVEYFLEELTARDRAHVENCLSSLTMRIIGALYQSKEFSRYWFLIIRNERRSLNRILSKSSALTDLVHLFWPKAYEEARMDVHYEFKVPLADIPKYPEITLSQVLDETWFPDSLAHFLSK